MGNRPSRGALISDGPLLQVRGVSVRYGPIRALDGVDLDIAPGELVALAGENGAGKSTLVRCIGGDIGPSSGQIWMGGRRVSADPRSAARSGVAVVWQDLALCDNLDVAANLLLGGEGRRSLFSTSRFHATAAALLSDLGIPIAATDREVGSLSGGQRQLVAVARAMRDHPDLLILDEPTAALGVSESAQVEELTARLRRQGTTILLVSHDVEQMFRLADRIAVLRQGRVVADLSVRDSHPDDVVALISGQEIDASARSQLSRLHGLSDQLAVADPSSGLSLILSALGAALGTEQLCIHLVDGDRLKVAAVLGLPVRLIRAWGELPVGSSGGPVGLAARSGSLVVEGDLRDRGAWPGVAPLLAAAGVYSAWSVPFSGPTGVAGVVTVLRRTFGPPSRDELNLVNLYTGYAAGAAERDRLLGEVTTRNRILETIRDVLETLAGPVTLSEGLVVALQALRNGLQADEVALAHRRPGGTPVFRTFVDSEGHHAEARSGFPVLTASTTASPQSPTGDTWERSIGDDWLHAVEFLAPAGPMTLVARWIANRPPMEAPALLDDAANSIRLALEREESERAHREATTLRRSQELQRQFLSRLSHELRTPLTAIRGYASSLMQTDVTWDVDSQDRFLSRIAEESSRLGRLVDDLLDFSAIESGLLRVHPDWCDLRLVLDAARACLPPEALPAVEVRCGDDLPPVWGDHDRLEQVLVNLLDNAVRHNPAGTRVVVEASVVDRSELSVTVTDDGIGVPAEVVAVVADPAGPGQGQAKKARRAATAGAGLGLSIALGIIEVHGGRLTLERLARGTRFEMRLPLDLGESGVAALHG